MSNLDSFIRSSRPPPRPVATSQDIRDRGSTFTANIYRATSVADARIAINHLKQVVHALKPASHEIAAWRCMETKHGRTGLAGEDDFELRSGNEDDGENWAGSKVLKVMQIEGIIDAVVIVSRWYGGTLLGPARFSHIETCAQEACRAFKRKEELDECISTLSTLDDILADLRADLASLSTEPLDTATSSTGTRQTSPVAYKTPKKPDYSAIHAEEDLSKAKRLIGARENAIKNVKSLIAKKKAQ